MTNRMIKFKPLREKLNWERLNIRWQLKDYFYLLEKEKNMKEKTVEEFITWLHKQLIEMMYNKELSSEQMTIYHKLIAKWREENESNISD